MEKRDSDGRYAIAGESVLERVSRSAREIDWNENVFAPEETSVDFALLEFRHARSWLSRFALSGRGLLDLHQFLRRNLRRWERGGEAALGNEALA